MFLHNAENNGQLGDLGGFTALGEILLGGLALVNCGSRAGDQVHESSLGQLRDRGHLRHGYPLEGPARVEVPMRMVYTIHGVLGQDEGCIRDESFEKGGAAAGCAGASSRSRLRIIRGG